MGVRVEWPPVFHVNMRDPDNTELFWSIDPATGAGKCVEYGHAETHSGSHFFIKDYQDVSAGTLDFLFITPDTTKWAHALWFFAGEGEFNLDLYIDATVSANGTGITPINRNGNSGTAATVAAYSGPTVSTTGTKIWGAKFGAGRTAGGLIRENSEYIGEQNTIYLFRATKVGAGTLWLDYLFDWYEHTNKF